MKIKDMMVAQQLEEARLRDEASWIIKHVMQKETALPVSFSVRIFE